VTTSDIVQAGIATIVVLVAILIWLLWRGIVRPDPRGPE
jgi:hypothetical protein